MWRSGPGIALRHYRQLAPRAAMVTLSCPVMNAARLPDAWNGA